MADEKKDAAPTAATKLAEQAETIAKLTSQVAALQIELDAIRRDPVKAEPKEVQDMVLEKMTIGLSKDQALEVARAQYAQDKRLAA